MRNLIKKILKESYYDSNKLYSKKYIDSVTKDADRNIKRIVKNAREVKLEIYYQVIIGLPSETGRDVRDTIFKNISQLDLIM